MKNSCCFYLPSFSYNNIRAALCWCAAVLYIPQQVEGVEHAIFIILLGFN